MHSSHFSLEGTRIVDTPWPTTTTRRIPGAPTTLRNFPRIRRHIHLGVLPLKRAIYVKFDRCEHIFAPFPLFFVGDAVDVAHPFLGPVLVRQVRGRTCEPVVLRAQRELALVELALLQDNAALPFAPELDAEPATD